MAQMDVEAAILPGPSLACDRRDSAAALLSARAPGTWGRLSVDGSLWGLFGRNIAIETQGKNGKRMVPKVQVWFSKYLQV